MARTKEPTGKGKGKAVASSSASKRPRKPSIIERDDDEEPQHMDVEDEEREFEEEMMEHDDDDDIEYCSDGLPKWRKNKRLSYYDEKYHKKMYRKKMKEIKSSIQSLSVCERQVYQPDFERFGVVECFERLGWEGSMSFHNDGIEEVYVKAILDWMETLKKHLGNNPPETTKLIGKVNGHEVELSFESISTLGSFDTGTTNGRLYEYPTDTQLAAKAEKGEGWKDMIRMLFEVPPSVLDLTKWSLKRNNLRVLPKLLLNFVHQNVMPRVGDKTAVREYEVMVLHALVTGTPALSSRHLIMYNIWESRERGDKKILPHCRLLSKLFKQANVLPRRAPTIKVIHTPFTINELPSTEWEYKKNARSHILRDLRSQRFIEILRDDVDLEDMESEEGGNEHEEEDEVTVRGMPEIFNAPYYQRLRDAVALARPKGYGKWSEFEKLMYDRQSQELEEGRIDRRARMYMEEKKKNEEFMHQERIRHEKDFKRGLPYTIRPRPVDWSSPDIIPFAQSHQLPHYPQTEPSEWLPINNHIGEWPSSTQEGSSAGSSQQGNSYNMETLQRSLYESFFGAPHPRPPYDS